MSISLVTSSLFRAVGVVSGPVQATASAAAIKWISKDGVGALGRLLVGKVKVQEQILDCTLDCDVSA